MWWRQISVEIEPKETRRNAFSSLRPLPINPNCRKGVNKIETDAALVETLNIFIRHFMCSWSQYGQSIHRAEGWIICKRTNCIDNLKLGLSLHFAGRSPPHTMFTNPFGCVRICCSVCARRSKRTHCRKSVCNGNQKRDKNVCWTLTKKTSSSAAAAIRLRCKPIVVMHTHTRALRSHSWTPANVLIIMLCGAQIHLCLFFPSFFWFVLVRWSYHIQKIFVHHFRALEIFTATRKRRNSHQGIFIAVHR